MKKITVILLFTVVLFSHNVFAQSATEADALIKGKIDLIYQAIKSGEVNTPIDGYTPMQIAARWATDTKIINDLVKAGADIHFQPKVGWPAVFVAAMDNPNPDIIKAFIDAGVDINTCDSTGEPLLAYAFSNSSNKIAIALIKLGADVNARSPKAKTLLMEALDPEIFQLLLRSGADVNARDSDGSTVLMQIAGRKNVTDRVLKTIVEAGADVNAVDKNGCTALMYAADRIDFTAAKTVYALRSLGAKVEIKDKNGKTALDHAKANDTLIGSHVYTLLEEALNR
ncbi:MAG: ankyrin repeat domain-containing protein [Candidatus Riflebacteria bacterium]|nr:ankyrin repeat domain-containing protein [Candidatus Riflebacteria bacterium]